MNKVTCGIVADTAHRQLQCCNMNFGNRNVGNIEVHCLRTHMVGEAGNPCHASTHGLIGLRRAIAREHVDLAPETGPGPVGAVGKPYDAVRDGNRPGTEHHSEGQYRSHFEPGLAPLRMDAAAACCVSGLVRELVAHPARDPVTIQ